MPISRRPAEDVRRAIIDAAIVQVGAHGVDELTHRAIAQTADVSLSSTTYHFASKGAIIAAALERVLQVDLARLSEDIDALTSSRNGAGPVTVAMFVDTLVAEVTEEEPVMLRARYHLLLEAAEQPELQPAVLAWQEEVLRRIAQLLELLGSSRAESDAQLLSAATNGLRLMALMSPPSARDNLLRPVLSQLVRMVTDLRD